MISSFRDYVIFMFGTAISLVTAILAVAINAAYRTYFEKHPFLMIFLCIAMIMILFGSFRKAVGLKFNEKTLCGYNIGEIQKRFEDEMYEEHPDLRKSYHFYSLLGRLGYELLICLLHLSIPLVIGLALFPVAYAFFWFVSIVSPNEGVLRFAEAILIAVLLFIGIPLYVRRFAPIIESLEEFIITRFKHEEEFAWNCHLLQLNSKECHVIFHPYRNQIIIKFFDENESLKVENKIRELGLECNGNMMYF